MSSDYQLEDTVYLPFTTRAFATGIPTALVSGVVDIYEDVTATPIIMGETLTVSLNSHAGFNMITVTATAATGFEAGKSYTAILDAGTVDSVSVIGEVVAHFTLDKSGAALDLANATDGLGAIKSDTAATLTDTAVIGALGAGLTDLGGMSTGMKGEVNAECDAALIDYDAVVTVDLPIDVNVTQIVGGTVPTPATTGIPDVNVREWLGTAVGANTAGVPKVDLERITGFSVPPIILRQWLDQGKANGVADSGTTTTLVDSALSEADDFWNGALLVFSGGTNDGYSAVVTDFDAASNTITFAPAVPSNVTTEAYTLIPGLGWSNVQAWLGSAPNALVGGRVDATVDATGMESGAVDAVWAKTMTELAAVPGVTGTVLAALEWLFQLARNKGIQTNTTKTLRNDADDADIATSAISSVLGTFTRGKWS